MKKIIYFALFILLSSFYSCETDFDVNADWKDITTVYCMLNKGDTAHYVKVNKAFLGNASAYEMAQHSDSFNYASANVYLIEFKKSTGDWLITRTLNCEKTTEILKDSGLFANDNNILYKTTAILNSSTDNTKYKYQLVVEIPDKEKVWSETEVFDNKIITPEHPLSNIQLHDKSPSMLEWRSITNARLYDINLRFYYYEITTTDTTVKYIDWAVATVQTSNLIGGEKLKVFFTGTSFFSNLSNKINKNDNNVIKRISKEKPFEITFLIGDDNLYTYMQVTAPSEGISQEKPAFTNINNGYGLFCARASSFYNNNNNGIKINTNKTLDSLHMGSLTSDLKFVTKNETTLYWLQHPD